MSSICMTHPDILKIECFGYLEKPRITGVCVMCKEDIQKVEAHYDFGDCLVCEGCDYDYMRQFRKDGV